MLFKNAFEQNRALHYVYEQLPLTSNLGRNHLLSTPFCTDASFLDREFELLANTISLIQNENCRTTLTRIRNNLHQINDIRSTLHALEAGNTILDDIQLFEIKKTAILSQRIADDFNKLEWTLFPLHNVEKTIALLDPEHTKIPHFYIYDAYDPALANWRDRIHKAQSVQEAEECRFQAQQIEDQIRARLTKQLHDSAKNLRENINTLAHFDVVLAKAKLAIQWQACRPTLAQQTSLNQLFHPEVAHLLQEQNKKFQPININFGKETIVITGANMAGKSVLLKTLSLAQYLFQFGFYIPAQSAQLAIVDEIICSMGDSQSETSGLSSFAVEILTIDKIIKAGRAGKRVLALVDELARTTNPEEGKCLVNNFIQLTQKLGITALVTTHYSGIQTNGRRLRVKGLQLDGQQTITPGNISDFMDYALVPTDFDEVPMEAFTIAKLLGVDEALTRLKMNESL